MKKILKEINDSKITRIEVINHGSKKHHPIGRILSLHKELEHFKHVEVDMQDDGRTMKIFLG